jgi:prepilin-type N-terminal cleavage/methylation domain-containing protein
MSRVGDDQETGFSITEVLITLFILSIGMMGVSRLLIEAKAIQQATLWQEQVTLLAGRITEMARAVDGRVSGAELKMMMEAKIAEAKEQLKPKEILSHTQFSLESIPENTHALKLIISKELPLKQSIEWLIEL